MFNKYEAARENNSGISNIAFKITSVNISREINADGKYSSGPLQCS
jgi:hypothetical protein